jgi:hypothetical protein
MCSRSPVLRCPTPVERGRRYTGNGLARRGQVVPPSPTAFFVVPARTGASGHVPVAAAPIVPIAVWSRVVQGVVSNAEATDGGVNHHRQIVAAPDRRTGRGLRNAPAKPPGNHPEPELTISSSGSVVFCPSRLELSRARR